MIKLDDGSRLFGIGKVRKSFGKNYTDITSFDLYKGDKPTKSDTYKSKNTNPTSSFYQPQTDKSLPKILMYTEDNALQIRLID